MAIDANATPVLLVGAGHMGGALVTGWLAADALSPADLLIEDPNPGSAARRAADAGARLGPSADAVARARTVVFAVKPQAWRGVAEALAPRLSPGTVVISIAAGVETGALQAAFPNNPIARAMPTTAAAINLGAASLYSDAPEARARARALFEPLGVVVDLQDEALMHLVTVASGSAPAFAYALVEALQAAAEAEGLPAADARALSRSALIGAGALLNESGEEASTLRRQVASPGGTTEAALRVLQARDNGLGALVLDAVRAGAARSRELGR